MNRAVRLSLMLIFAFTFAGCGGNAAGDGTTDANTGQTAANNAPNTVVSSNQENLQSALNGETKEIESGFPVPANANVVVVNTNQAVDTIREKPAPDDSTFTAEMNAKGQPVETRTFRSHPVLAKIEKITLNPREYVFKVYLKNGKVIESKSDELKDFRVIAPENILLAVGVKPPAPKQDESSNAEEMKKAEMEKKAKEVLKPVLIPKANP
jgi:hypothetical protein